MTFSKVFTLLLVTGGLALPFDLAAATTHYVDLNSSNPVTPYSDWSHAATTIQDAVDAAAAGDNVLVTNGIYQSGGRVIAPGALTNRVAVDKALTIESVNGPNVTVIQGYQVPVTTNGDAAVRCVLLPNNAVLIGFTLTNGATLGTNAALGDQIGGGARCSTVSVLSNCVIAGNAAAAQGGGAYSGILNNCTLSANWATNGGGSYSSKLTNCILSGNFAPSGGGAYQSRGDKCLIKGNSALNGGGLMMGAFNNSILVGNRALKDGGGGYFAILTNCTVVNNSANLTGGGVEGDTLINCIIYYNSAPSGENAYNATAYNCCISSPSFVSIINPLTNAPAFANVAAGDFHLTAPSPCINAGNNSGITGNDLDGKPRIVGGTVDIGAYEFPATIHYVTMSNSAPQSPYTSWAHAATKIQDAIDASTNGDFVLVTNGVYRTGGRVVYGSMTNRVAVMRPITLQSVNGPAVTAIEGLNPGLGVSPGPVTIIRCVYLTNGAALLGFTLTNGEAASNPAGINDKGGGVYCEDSSAVISNCIFIANSAMDGGGAYRGTLFNCLLIGNTAFGAAAAASNTLNNCSLSGNSNPLGSSPPYVTSEALGSALNNCTVSLNVGYGPALVGCTANNSIVYFNTNLSNAQFPNFTNSSLNYCCTTPLPATGANNFTNQPRFFDPLFYNVHLMSTSPCINAGQNSLVANSIDLDGNPRIRGDAVDLGAYEFQADATGQFPLWLQQHGLSSDGSVDFSDSDGDGMNNWQEWFANTDPTNASSALQLFAPTPTNSSMIITWQSTQGRIYFLQRSTNFTTTFSTIKSNIVGQAGTTSYTDPASSSKPSFFYRVGVQ